MALRVLRSQSRKLFGVAFGVLRMSVPFSLSLDRIVPMMGACSRTSKQTMWLNDMGGRVEVNDRFLWL